MCYNLIVKVYPQKIFGFSITWMRLALAVVFIWFGLLKFLNVSPVVDIIARAYPIITENHIFYLSLAILEIFIGIGLLIPKLVKISAIVAIFHLLIATLGVLFSPQAFLTSFPFLSLVGEFVIKNFVLIGAALVIIAHGRQK